MSPRPGPRLTDRGDLHVAPSCADCGAQRLTLNGSRELVLGEACEACGSFTVRVPVRAEDSRLGGPGQPPATGKRRPGPSSSTSTVRGGTA